MECDFNEFKRDCSKYDCDQLHRDCMDKVRTLEEECQKEVDVITNDYKQKTLRQGGIWGTVGAGAAFAGLLLFPGPGWIAAGGIILISGGIGFLGGAASKADDCADDITKKEDDCAKEIRKAKDECVKAKMKCEADKACCEVWNSLMSQIGKVRNENDCDRAYFLGYGAFVSDIRPEGMTRKCEDQWKAFKDVWEPCCKK